MQPSSIVYFASGVAAIGGFLFGYDMGIISGAKSQLQRDLRLSCGQLEAVVTMLPIGALVASLLGGESAIVVKFIVTIEWETTVRP